MEIKGLIGKILAHTIYFSASPVLRIKADQDGVRFSLERPIAERNVDKRIEKIEEAKSNLQEALAAINDLDVAAKESKGDVDRLLKELEKLEADKASTQEKLNTLSKIAETDTSAFREIIGIPSKSQQWRDKIMGFILGVLASLLASYIYTLVSQ